MFLNRNSRVTVPDKYFATWKRYLTGEVAVGAPRGDKVNMSPFPGSSPHFIGERSARGSGNEFKTCLRVICYRSLVSGLNIDVPRRT